MDTFIYNKFVTGKNFIGRRNETNILGNLLSQSENVVIYEPPKAGKTSLIQQTFFNMKIAGKRFNIAQLSLLNIRTRADLMMRLGTTLIRVVASTPDEYAQAVHKYLGATHFIFDPEVFAAKDQILSLNWDIDENDVKAILSLPYNIAADMGVQLYVIIDEFQNVMLTEDGDKLLKVFESVIKGVPEEFRRKACFIFSGSQYNAMNDIFQVKRYFWRMVERVELQEIETKDIVDSVVRSFLASGKVIERDLVTGVCKLFRNNIFYINHFAAICDSLTKGYIMEPVMVDSLDAILAIHEPRFVAIMNDLTTFQVCLLRAILDGHTKFSSSEVIRHYNLNSSANVRRLKDALCKKEIVAFDNEEEPRILDPLFEYWVAKYYFEIKQR